MKQRHASKVSFFFAIFFMAVSLTHAQQFDLWIGTAGNKIGQPAGVYKATLDEDGSVVAKPTLVRAIDGAGWVAAARHGAQNPNIMYATAKVDGKRGVAAFDAGEPAKPLQFQMSGDGGSCFVTTDRTGRLAISAQYGGGSITVFPIDPAAGLLAATQLIEHRGGSGVVGKRQNSPHPHYVAISPDNRFAFVPDLGLDQLVRYQIDTENQKLVAAGQIDVEPGGGPRHMKFHPNGKFAFVLNELSLSVTVFAYAADTGEMTKLKTVVALDDSEKEINSFNSASEIRIHNNGRMIVTANRGHDSLSVFRFDEESIELTRSQVEPIRGSWPRNFNFSPGGKLLIVAGCDSNSLSLFDVDSDDCRLRYRQHSTLFVPAPICVTVAPNQ